MAKTLKESYRDVIPKTRRIIVNKPFKRRSFRLSALGFELFPYFYTN